MNLADHIDNVFRNLYPRAMVKVFMDNDEEISVHVDFMTFRATIYSDGDVGTLIFHLLQNDGLRKDFGIHISLSE